MPKLLLLLTAVLLLCTPQAASSAEDKGDYVAMTKLGIECQDRGDRRSALKYFNKAIAMNPGYPSAHFFAGRAYSVMQDYDKAIAEFKIFKDSIKKSPATDEETKGIYIANLSYISEAYFTLKMYDDMKQELDGILELDPNNQDATYNLGVYYYVAEYNRSRAYQSFTKAIEIDPSSHIARNARYAIEFIRINPDARFAPDFSFIDREYRD